MKTELNKNEKLSKEQENPPIANVLLVAGGSDAGVLKRFMVEFFPFTELRKAGFFTKEMKVDYYAQAKRVCDLFGYKSVFEYGAKEIRCHLSYVGERPENDKEFITVIPSIYD
jgi:hypothetical protein